MAPFSNFVKGAVTAVAGAGELGVTHPLRFRERGQEELPLLSWGRLSFLAERRAVARHLGIFLSFSFFPCVF